MRLPALQVKKLRFKPVNGRGRICTEAAWLQSLNLPILSSTKGQRKAR